MAKDWDEYSPYKQDKLAKELGKQFGIDRDKYQEQDRGSQGNFDSKGYNQAIANAMANDYDTRSALAGARAAGMDAPDIKGISNMSEAYKVNQWMQNAHQNELGNSGKFSSANDYGNVANYYQQAARKDDIVDTIVDDATESEGAYDPGAPSLSDLMNGDTGSISEGVVAAAKRQSLYATDATDGSQSSRRYGYDARRGDEEDYSQTRAFDFLTDYKLDLKNQYN